MPFDRPERENMDRGKIESILRENGYDEFRWISGADVVVSQWPRFKCMYGCPSYGKVGSCPPSVPPVAGRAHSRRHRSRSSKTILDAVFWKCAASFSLTPVQKRVSVTGSL